MAVFYYVLGAGCAGLAILAASVRMIHHAGRSTSETVLSEQVAELQRALKVLVARVGELNTRAERNTEALERAVTQVAALTTRVERVERASHHHVEMDSLRRGR